MKRLLVVVASAAVLVGAGASGAFAGEVKGPPNQPNNTNETGALDHGNSACAASGLNDLDSTEGQTVSQARGETPCWSRRSVGANRLSTFIVSIRNPKERLRPPVQLGDPPVHGRPQVINSSLFGSGESPV
jgi:hypothetical protein